MNLQMKHKVVQKLFLSFAVVGVLTNFVIQNVYACTPAPMTPWFAPSLSLVSTSLPKGSVEITTVDGNLTLKNFSGYSIRVIIDNVYQEKNGYEEFQNNQSAVLSVSDNDDLLVNSYRITSLDHRNKIEDNRPADIKIPEPQTAWVQLLINDQSYYMQLEISYAINLYYRPDSVYLYENGCINWSNQILFEQLKPLAGFVLLVSLVVITVSIIFIIKLMKRH